MSKRLIKICGLHDPQLAEAVATLGADYIGIMLHQASKRRLDVNTAQLMSDTVKKTTAKSVLLPGKRSDAELKNLCREFDVDAVQLYRDEHHLAAGLPSHLVRFFAFSLGKDDVNEHYLNQLGFDAQRDFLIFDSSKPGSGQCFSEVNFVATQYPFFVAGGLCPDNVAEVIKRYQPHGVDVSSGVEHAFGLKDMQLVKKFIENVHHE